MYIGAFHDYFPILAELCISNLHIMLFDIREFRGNRRGESNILLVVVNKITFTRVP